MHKEIGKFKKKKEGTQLKKLKVGGPAPRDLRATPLHPAPALSPLRPCAPAAPSLHPDHTQISFLCAPCCTEPAPLRPCTLVPCTLLHLHLILHSCFCQKSRILCCTRSPCRLLRRTHVACTPTLCASIMTLHRALLHPCCSASARYSGSRQISIIID
ncbi:hypothetical protein SLEP1_g48025 [Rubroshorea leprosula]|uniref:Uncharacterized protein n=1 Tax=Rubroshorea leprosula TaxID=152421 RepID=A0AAV5LSC6_9ROSI|nr:hypothetical protein SLEP1_g48025 [Rubroshorea leprosula]